MVFMFSVGDYVVYGGNGVCLVESIGTPTCACNVKTDYYFLSPVSYAGRIYAPVDTHVPMRAILTRDEALTLLRDMPSIPSCVNLSRDKRQLSEHYKQILSPHTCYALVTAVKSIREKSGLDRRHPVTQTEEDILKRSRAALVQELALALQVDETQAEHMLLDALRAKTM